jgi:hypothetical protein
MKKKKKIILKNSMRLIKMVTKKKDIIGMYGYTKVMNLEELKRIIIKTYYPNINEQQLAKEMERKLIIKKINDCYNTPSTIIFSVEGSPPKGVGVLLRGSYEEEIEGELFILCFQRKKIFRKFVKIETAMRNWWD